MEGLDAVVVGAEALGRATEGRKFAAKSIILISNLGGKTVDADPGPVAKALQAQGIELRVMYSLITPPSTNLDEDQAIFGRGPSVQLGAEGKVEDEDEPGPSNGQGPKSEWVATAEMREGAKLLQRLAEEGVDAACFSFSFVSITSIAPS